MKCGIALVLVFFSICSKARAFSEIAYSRLRNILTTARTLLARVSSNKIRKSMHVNRKLVFAALVALILLPARAAQPPPPPPMRKNWRRCCTSSMKPLCNFRSTTADFEFDSVETDPVPTRTCKRARSTTSARAAPSRWPRTSAKSTASRFPRSTSTPAASIKLYEKLHQPGHHAQQAQPVRKLVHAGLRRQRQGSGHQSGRSSTWARRRWTA